MEKLIFKDLMDALNMKIYNIDKFAIIECYTATRFSVGQIRLLLSSLSTTEFRYRALLALVEYMPVVSEHDAVHIVNTISECESQSEIRIKALTLLVRYDKLQERGEIGSVYRVVTRKSISENTSMMLQLAVQKNSFEEDYSINSTINEIESNCRTLHQPATANRAEFFRANRRYMMPNQIHPIYSEKFGIEEVSSSHSNLPSKCCIL